MSLQRTQFAFISLYFAHRYPINATETTSATTAATCALEVLRRDRLRPVPTTVLDILFHASNG